MRSDKGVVNGITRSRIMDAIRVSRVENVACTKYGVQSQGCVHLTAHHLIFRYQNDNEQELWVPYPLVSLVTRLPVTLQGKSPLTFHCRTFESFTLSFAKESEAIDVFESVKELTVTASVTQLYAFYYSPSPPLPTKSGWSIYSPREEFGRMGVGTRTKAWRFTDINDNYSFSPTYPARLVVPTKISDTTLQYASKYRSKCRIPVLTYLHWSSYATITRSSQPMVGITQSRSIQDEKLIESVFQSHHYPDSHRTYTTTPIYGATSTNVIIDARPTTNAVANTAKGAGTENMDHYKDARKAYLGIDNIHVMRESLHKVVDALREADSLSASVNENMNVGPLMFLDRQALRRSGWLRHISSILEGALLITRNIHVNSSHVLIHCSDGWDRTAQLSSLAQLCLDPFYRTIRGFEILIEKDWLSFGHRFLDRCGHLSSEKFFISPSDAGVGGDGSGESFLASVQSRFASQPHLKETSPVFHQFLESVRQIQRQFPDRFEFNERFLQQIHYHLYACQFGTFLFNCERDRKVGSDGPPYIDRTVSAWDFFNSPEETEKNLNPTYDKSLDDPMRRDPKADMGVLYPNPKDVRFWHELYGRKDDEMNGRAFVPQAEGSETPLRAGDEPAGKTAVSGSIPQTPERTPSPSANIRLERSSTRPPSGLSSSTPQLSRTGSADSSRVAPAGSPWSPSPLSSSTPSIPFSRKQPDLFSSGAVKSMWGKLSSNASAAFSAVQDAYAGVAKDLKGHVEREMTDSSTSDPREIGDWRSGETSALGAFRESDEVVMPRNLAEPDPWAGVTSQPSSSPTHDNPWSSVPSASSATSPDMKQTKTSLTTPSLTLPLDPTVAYPLMPSRQRSSSAADPGREVGVNADAKSGREEIPKTASSLPPPSPGPTSDPLGVTSF